MPRNGDSIDDGPSIHQVNITTRREDPTTALINTIAELKNADTKDLNPLYSCINHLVEHLFQTPPPDEADAVLTFTYEGFRITLYQNGLAVIRSAT